MPPSRDLVSFLESVVYGKRKDIAAVCTKGMLNVLSGIYRGGIELYLLPFDMGWRKQFRLERPVISVGNITVGGTGKSPMVQYISRGLVSRGWKPAVLSYGYGGALHGQFGVVSDRSKVLLTPQSAGDEPTMLATSMPGVPVLVGKDRVESGMAAIEDLGSDVLVLDDGFQVWKLYRDLDIVLVNAENPFDNGRPLPAGKLREPISALERADCVIATGNWEQSRRDELADKVREYAPDAPVFFGQVQPSAVISLAGWSRTSVEAIEGKKAFAISSIANPAPFERMLGELGAVVVGTERLQDHHQYTAKDISHINRCAEEADARMIITTEKDAIKLDARQFSLPVMVLSIEPKIEDEDGFWEFIASKIGSPAGQEDLTTTPESL